MRVFIHRILPRASAPFCRSESRRSVGRVSVSLSLDAFLGWIARKRVQPERQELMSTNPRSGWQQIAWGEASPDLSGRAEPQDQVNKYLVSPRSGRQRVDYGHGAM